MRAGSPLPKLASRDPYALRALVLILVVATFFAAGSERTKRVAAAFDWQGVVAPANFRIDAWVTPPTYTGRPPQILPGLRPGEPVRNLAAVSVPAGSTLVVRSTGKADFNVAVAGGVAELQGGDARPQAPAGTQELRYTITDNGSATVRGGGDNLVWSFTAIPDRVPVIALAKEPEGQTRGALQLVVQDRGRLRRDRRAGGVREEAARRSRPPSRRVRSTARPTSRWCCRSRAPRTASARPSRI